MATDTVDELIFDGLKAAVIVSALCFAGAMVFEALGETTIFYGFCAGGWVVSAFGWILSSNFIKRKINA